MNSPTASAKHSLKALTHRWPVSIPRCAPTTPCSTISPPRRRRHPGTHTASEPTPQRSFLIVFGDNPERTRSEAAFAKLCGACPIPTTSGQTSRHRLYRGSHRQANPALYQIATARKQLHQPTIGYAARRTTEGPTKKRGHHPLPQTVPHPRGQPTRHHRSPNPTTHHPHPLKPILDNRSDNALTEPFRARTQVELPDRRRWRTRTELANAPFEYLEIYPQPATTPHRPGDANTDRMMAITEVPQSRSS